MIRPVALDDAAALAALYTRNRRFLAPFEPPRPDAFFTVEGQRQRLEQALAARAQGSLWRFVILDDGAEIAGIVAIENVVRGAAQSANVAYWVDQRRNGRGLATAALACAIEVAFGDLALHRLQAGTRVDNLASQRVLAKSGFEQIGRARRYLYVGGAWRDHLLFQRLADTEREPDPGQPHRS